LTNDFRRAADSYLDLPPILESAIEVLRHEKLDVLIFPEIGMDEWMVYLSYHRFARVQCVFWGHPVTTANPAIDYFISSEYFLPDFFEENFEDKKEIDSKNMDTSPGQYHKSTFSEQMVLFRGLSTFFTKPKVARRFQNPSSHARAVLHLPEDKKLYVCPQTLMKLHPDFDHVLHGILSRDKDAYIIMLYSSTQNVWKEKVRMRWRRTLGRLHTRIIFYSTMPYTEFMSLLSIADVLLDPFPWGGGVTTLDGLAFGM
jgi:predicted O-linked N-acetylglucosamine transferase (SPINDLY family)